MAVTPTVNDQAILAELKNLGFSDVMKETPYHLVASLSGLAKTGKTHFSCTAPEPIIFINVDIGTEGVVNKFQAGFDGQPPKQVLIYDVRVPKEGTTQDVYKTMWLKLKSLVLKAYTLKQGTIIYDTSSETYELARLAHFGKLTQVMPHNYQEVNNEWKDLLRTAYDSPMNTIFIHKMKPKWVNNARTSEFELAGFADMCYLSQINLTTHRTGEGENIEFSVSVDDCRINHRVGGEFLEGPMCDFNILLSLVHGR